MIQTVKGPALHKNLQPRRWSSLYLMFFCPIRVKEGKASSPAATSSSLTSASPELGATLDLELLLAGEKLRCFGSPQGFPGPPEPHFILQQLPSGLRGSAAADSLKGRCREQRPVNHSRVSPSAPLLIFPSPQH